jgi:hypothetical protein
MRQRCLHGLLACSMGLMSSTQAAGQEICRPALAFKEAHYSHMQLPKLERTWTAVASVDASRCLTFSGSFEIVFVIEGENAPDYEVRDAFAWTPGAVKLSKEFWADEAVASYRVDNIATCPCRK